MSPFHGSQPPLDKESPASSSSSDLDIGAQMDKNIGDVEKQKEEQVVASALDWDGPGDPLNPRNWPTGQRIFQVLPPAFFSFVVTLAAPIYATATQQIQDEFNVGQTAAILPLFTLTIGLGIGPLFAAPLSEMFGRKHVYIWTFLIFLIFTMAAGLAPNFVALCIFRLLAGCAGGPALAIGAGTISDIWDTSKDGGPAALLFIIMPFLGTSLAPVFGGLIAHGRTWRWTMWLNLIIGGAVWVGCVPFMKESFKPELLRKRAVKEGRELPPKPDVSFHRFLMMNLIRPLHMLTTEPIVLAISLYTSFAFGVLFLFFPALAWSFGTQYHFDRRESGLIFISNIVGILIGAIAFILIDAKIYKPRQMAEAAKGGRAPVELRLVGAMVGSVGLPISLFVFAWTCRASIHWIVPVIFIAPFGFGMILIFISCTTYMVDTYQYKTSASALAANGVLRYLFGSVFPLFALQMYKALEIGLATSVLGIISVILMAVPFVFFHFGKQFRLRSAYDTLRN
ncbi:hypothetical protein ABW19_dt0210505 [Dactylella cylindrospora]|nr:hypothetical protein ABW19_dt0210505 [Dactylella cylindrospora]